MQLSFITIILFRRVGAGNKKASLVKGDSPVRGDVLEEDRGVCRLRLSKGDRCRRHGGGIHFYELQAQPKSYG